MQETILAVDPGRYKAGLAVVRQPNEVLWQGIVSAAEMLPQVSALVHTYNIAKIVLGNRTGSKEARSEFSLYLQAEQCGIPIITVDEHRTTELARQRYWQEHPPQGWRRFIPLGLQVPPCPVDDYAAIILAERYFSSGEIAINRRVE